MNIKLKLDIFTEKTLKTSKNTKKGIKITHNSIT